MLLNKIAKIGARAPQLFFIISAFLTWKSIDKRGIGSGFFINRAKRLIPIYYLSLICAMLIPTITIKDYSIGNIIAHFLLLHGFHPLWINKIVGAGWYIGDLVIFYMICPFLAKVIVNLKTSIVCATLSLILSSLLLVGRNLFGTPQELDFFFDTFLFFHQLPVLMIGVVLYYIIYGEMDDAKKTRLLIIGAVLSVVFFIVFIGLRLNKKLFTSSFASAIVFLWIFLAAHQIKHIFASKLFSPLIFLGKHSLGIYLIHCVVIESMLLFPLHRTSFVAWICLFAIVMIVSIAWDVSINGLENKAMRLFTLPTTLN